MEIISFLLNLVRDTSRKYGGAALSNILYPTTLVMMLVGLTMLYFFDKDHEVISSLPTALGLAILLVAVADALVNLVFQEIDRVFTPFKLGSAPVDNHGTYEFTMADAAIIATRCIVFLGILFFIFRWMGLK